MYTLKAGLKLTNQYLPNQEERLIRTRDLIVLIFSFLLFYDNRISGEYSL
jgi:hypothetical protein